MMHRATSFVARLTAAAATVVVITALVALSAPGTAGADPAGPTDYETEIISVRPDPGTVELWIEGGDAFVVIDVEIGTEVVVPGYRGEPFLWIDADGIVRENVRSPATYENTQRYGVDVLPPMADHTAPPEWRQVATGGTWAWHDHRAHRMDPFPPINVDRGEQVLDASIPLMVDGVDITVRVTSRWMPAPSPWPGIVGALVGAGLTVLLRRRPAIAVAVVGVAALVVGAVQFGSLHPATDPSWLWWGAPTAAIAASMAAMVSMASVASMAGAVGVIGARRRGDPRPPGHRAAPATPLWVSGATLVGAAQLLVWGLERRLGLTRAVLATDLPFWLDRAVTGAALSTGVVAIAVTIAGLIRSWSPAPAPSPAPR